VKPGDNGQPAPGDRARQLEREVARLRRDIGDLMSEINRRPQQPAIEEAEARRPPVGFIVVAAAAAIGVVGAAAWLAVARRRRARTVRSRLQHLGHSARREIAHPARAFANPASLSRKLAVAGGSALASVAVRELAKKVFD